jgi:hypothetical protein
VLIAERFGKFPEECEDRDADRALFYNAILGIEGKANRLIKDLRPGDELVLAEDEDELGG